MNFLPLKKMLNGKMGNLKMMFAIYFELLPIN